MQEFKKHSQEYSVIPSKRWPKQVQGLGLWAIFLAASSLAFPGRAWGQVSLADSSIRLATLEVRYQGFFPTGPMAERWGYGSTVGLEAGAKARSNFFFSLGLYSLFSGAVDTEGILAPLASNGGFLITDDGVVSEPRVLGTGLLIPLRLGYLWGWGPNPNSGPFVSLGGQFLRYRFDFRSSDGSVAGLTDDYERGYDHLVSGWGLTQSLGYRLFSSQGYVNFAAGIELSQNFTRYRRAYHFASGPPDPRLRLDLLWGFFVAWTFPLYQRAPDRVYYY